MDDGCITDGLVALALRHDQEDRAGFIRHGIFYRSWWDHNPLPLDSGAIFCWLAACLYFGHPLGSEPGCCSGPLCYSFPSTLRSEFRTSGPVNELVKLAEMIVGADREITGISLHIREPACRQGYSRTGLGLGGVGS